MSIASINAQILANSMEVSNIELQIMLLDNHRQRIAYQSQELSTEFSTRLSKKTMTIDLADDLTDEDEDALELEWQQFKIEYEIAETRLNAQDKVLEQERTRIETKKTMLTTANESLEKRLQKNIEADMKGSN